MPTAHDREALMVTLRSYFDLCAQEYFMYTEGVIEESDLGELEAGTHFLHVTADFPRGLRPAEGGNVPPGIPRMACRTSCRCKMCQKTIMHEKASGFNPLLINVG